MALPINSGNVMSTLDRNTEYLLHQKSKTRLVVGFTLIEMLVVMAIISLLLTIALPRYWHAVDQSKETALVENLRITRLSIDRYYSDKGKYPQTLQDLVDAKYLRSLPMDPITQSQQTWILIPSTNRDEPGIMDLKSGAIGHTRQGAAYETL